MSLVGHKQRPRPGPDSKPTSAPPPKATANSGLGAPWSSSATKGGNHAKSMRSCPRPVSGAERIAFIGGLRVRRILLLLHVLCDILEHPGKAPQPTAARPALAPRHGIQVNAHLS